MAEISQENQPEKALNIKRYFSVQRFTFAGLGLDPTSEERTVKQPALMLVPTLSICIVLIGMLHYAGKHITNVEEVTEALGPFWQCFLAVFKMVLFLYHRKRMVGLVKNLMAWNMEATEEELKILATHNGRDILFCRCYFYMVLTSGTTALLSPVITAAVSYITKGEYELQPPLLGTYIVDYKSSIFNYLIVLIWNGLGIYHCLFASVSIDSLFSWYANNIIAQFHILDLRLRQTAEEDDGNVPLKSISRIIEYHRRTIDIADELNSTFGSVIFVKFTLSCIQICCLAYQFSKGGPKMDMAYKAAFLMSIAMQLILYCNSGQQITDESGLISVKIYDAFHWHKLSVKSQKALLLPMMRTSNTCKLSGIFFVVDLSLYVWVFRTAASYITMLWALDEK